MSTSRGKAHLHRCPRHQCAACPDRRGVGRLQRQLLDAGHGHPSVCLAHRRTLPQGAWFAWAATMHSPRRARYPRSGACSPVILEPWPEHTRQANPLDRSRLANLRSTESAALCDAPRNYPPTSPQPSKQPPPDVQTVQSTSRTHSTMPQGIESFGCMIHVRAALVINPAGTHQ